MNPALPWHPANPANPTYIVPQLIRNAAINADSAPAPTVTIAEAIAALVVVGLVMIMCAAVMIYIDRKERKEE